MSARPGLPLPAGGEGTSRCHEDAPDGSPASTGGEPAEPERAESECTEPEWPGQTPVRARPAGYGRIALPGGRSLLVHRRSLAVAVGLLGVAFLVAIATLTTGPYKISPGRIARILAGDRTGAEAYLLLEQRLPRVVAAAAVGACLAASGAIFQTTSRNPLGSPDLIGFTTGAATGGILIILLAGEGSQYALVAGTFFGGFAAATAVMLIGRAGAGTGQRLIVGGIAVAAMLSSTNDYLISRAEIEAAEKVKAWQHGSLNAVSWQAVVPLAVAAAVLVPAALACSRDLRFLELGEEAAAGVGVSIGRARTLAMCMGVFLAAVAVATAGPIGFVALVAPQLSRRLARSPGIAILPAMATGAVLLMCSDFLAQRLLSPFQIPVGLVTGVLGGVYLAWLLLGAERRGGWESGPRRTAATVRRGHPLTRTLRSSRRPPRRP